MKRQGDRLWSVYKQTVGRDSAGKAMVDEMRVVVNDHYSAVWPRRGNPLAYQSDHVSWTQADPRQRTRVELNTPKEFLEFGFGEAVNIRLQTRGMVKLDLASLDFEPSVWSARSAPIASRNCRRTQRSARIRWPRAKAANAAASPATVAELRLARCY